MSNLQSCQTHNFAKFCYESITGRAYVSLSNVAIYAWKVAGECVFYNFQNNTFQCVLVSSVQESFVIFLYPDKRIEWTTGDHINSGGRDGLGGFEAIAGINAGDGVNSITIPGSPSIINITKTSNVGIPGIWMFKVDGGNIIMCTVFLVKPYSKEVCSVIYLIIFCGQCNIYIVQLSMQILHSGQYNIYIDYTL